MEGRAPASLWDRATFVWRRRGPPSIAKEFAIPSSFLFRTSEVSILLPKTSQIILDNVVVLDKETASFDAPLGAPGKSLSAIHYQP
jgi:hypothetical protein